MSRSFTLLVNPRAGGGSAAAAALPVVRLLRAAGARVSVERTPAADATAALVETAVAAGSVVVAAGGDGMVSSVVGPVSRAGGTLGLVPGGRGNDFARMLGLPSTPEGLARVLLGGDVRRVDLLSYELVGSPPRVVAGSVYAGVDAEAAALVGRLGLLPRGAQYPVAAVRALATYRAGDYAVGIDGKWRHHRAATVVVANSAYYGSGMRIAPTADVADGLLDIVVVAAASRAELIRSVPRLYDGSHVDLPHVTIRTGRRVELRAATGRVPVGADGEPLGRLPSLSAAPASVSVLPGALSVLTP